MQIIKITLLINLYLITALITPAMVDDEMDFLLSLNLTKLTEISIILKMKQAAPLVKKV